MSNQKPSNASSSQGAGRVLLTLDDYAAKDQHPPTTASLLYTGVFILAGLVASEMLFRYFFFQIKGSHPILEDEINRQILARHLGVDCLSLLLLALMGWQGRSIVKSVAEEWVQGKKGAVAPAGYLNRLYTVHPEALRISNFFLWYQVKNLYDSIVWDDGIEYIGHHIFSILCAWVVLGPFFVHFYSIFYFGLSEFSTFVLCILANFDDAHGVVGLGEAFPIVKIVVGAVFVVLFIFCRCVMWPVFSYHFCVDTWLALKELDARTTVVRQRWLKFLCVALTFMSLLQAAWLGQIFIIAKEEFTKVGLI
ncbi:hypothetical protein ACA910_020445 [Epithemia clementina (nom. ined.)]